jgi:hypothetical protein
MDEVRPVRRRTINKGGGGGKKRRKKRVQRLRSKKES